MNMIDDSCCTHTIKIIESQYEEIFCGHFVYSDTLYGILHDLKIEVGDIIKLYITEKSYTIIEITEIEYGDGTIWYEILEESTDFGR